ncbi:MAG: hypothetical protein MJ200_05265 [Mycoplasmoidaceae bacterium]|nr:hypothetical protein [Mycoplasmoidaceae bacterium]
MRDSKKIRKLLYLSKSNIALIIMNDVDNEHNILFAHQVKVDEANLQFKILELLTNAANFVGFNIKEVEIIFDDAQITKYSFTNQEFVDCNCEEDIAKEIYKKAKIDNYFVNEINFLGINYDEIEKVARVNCQVCASDYITYKKYIKAVKACNVAVVNSTNLYKLQKTNKNEIELTLNIDGSRVIACEYYGKRLNNVKTINLNLEDIKQHVADKFNISIKKIEDVLKVANELASCVQDDIAVVKNYDLKTKSFNKVNLKELLALYRDEIRTQINNYVDYRNFQTIQVISNQPINAIDGFEFVVNEDVCLDGINLDKIVSLANIDINANEITQFNFENKIKPINLPA